MKTPFRRASIHDIQVAGMQRRSQRCARALFFNPTAGQAHRGYNSCSMRWPTRALVLVGLRFEDADAERRFAHSLRTKQLISFIILQFAYVVIAFAVAARLPSEADTPFMVIIAFLVNLICTAALAYARKLGPELRLFWIPDALLAATAVLAPLEQYRMVSYWCRADGMVCDQTYIAQNTHELTVTALLLVLSTPTRIVYLLPHAILLPSVIIADPDAAFLPHSSLHTIADVSVYGHPLETLTVFLIALMSGANSFGMTQYGSFVSGSPFCTPPE